MDDIQRVIELLEDEMRCACYRDESMCGICKTYTHINRDEIIAACKYAIHAMQELQQYRQIGTTEEFQEAREKRKPVPVLNREVLRDSTERPYCIQGDCPTCGCLHVKSDKTDYCPACGQHIDWRKEEK